MRKQSQLSGSRYQLTTSRSADLQAIVLICSIVWLACTLSLDSDCLCGGLVDFEAQLFVRSFINLPSQAHCSQLPHRLLAKMNTRTALLIVTSVVVAISAVRVQSAVCNCGPNDDYIGFNTGCVQTTKGKNWCCVNGQCCDADQNPCE